MNGLFGINTFDVFTWVLKVPLALALGIGASFVFFRQSLEGRLRQRRSPGKVRRESWAWALAIIGVIPCLMGGWDLGIYVFFFIAAVVLAVIGRAGWQTWAMLAATMVLGVGAMALHLTYTASINRGLHHSAGPRGASSSGFTGSATPSGAPAATPPPPDAGVVNAVGPTPTGETPK